MSQAKNTRMPFSKPRHQAHHLLLVPLLLAVPSWAMAQTEARPTFSQTSDIPGPTEAVGAKPAQPKVAPAPPPITPAPRPAPGAMVPSPDIKPRRCNWEWVRDGFYLRVVSGLSAVKLSGNGPSGSASISGLGSTSLIAIGGHLGHGLVLAGTVQSTDVSGTFKGGPYADATFASNGKEVKVSQKAAGGFGSIGAFLDWYPMQAEGLHVGAGVGMGLISVVNQADDNTLSGGSTSGTLLVGYDWPISPTWAFGLALVASGSTSKSLKDQQSKNDSGYKLGASSIGLSVSFLYF
jgi:hypothetical protein